MNSLVDLIEVLDAAIFTGDHLEIENNRLNLQYHLSRWKKALDNAAYKASTLNIRSEDVQG